MEAHEGVQFLAQLLQSPQNQMTAADLEEAIRLAGQYSPSSAIDRAGRHYRVAHPSAGQMEALTFGKGVRWLAMVRRDEGQIPFETAVEGLWDYVRTILPTQKCVWCGKPGQSPAHDCPEMR